MPNNPSYPANVQYQGQSAYRSQHARTSGDGRLLFFEMDGNLYDGDGFLIADARAQGCTECLEPGVMEFVSVPVPGSCNLFYLFSAMGRDTYPGYFGTHVQWSLLDMNADNPRFPAQAPTTCARKGRLLQYEELGEAPYQQFNPWIANDPPAVEDAALPNGIPTSNRVGALIPMGAGTATGSPRMRVVESTTASGDHWLFAIIANHIYLYRIAADGIYHVNPIAGSSSVQFMNSWNPNNVLEYFHDADAVLTTLTGQQDEVLALAIAQRYEMYPHPATQNSSNNLLVHYFNRTTGALISGQSQAFAFYPPVGTCGGVTVNLPNGGFAVTGLRGCAFTSDGRGLYLTGERTLDCITAEPYAAHLDLVSNAITDISYAFGQGMDPQWTRARIYRNKALNGVGTGVYIPAQGQVGVLQGLENLAAVTFTATGIASVSPGELYNGTRPADCGYVPRFLDIGVAHDRYLSPQNRATCCAFLQTRGSGLIYGHEQVPGMQPTSWTATSNPYGNASPLTCLCDIVVKPGAGLYPSNLAIKFADDAKLVVERGATVLATNITFTSITCPSERWPGIRVEGTTNNGTQSAPHQGYLRLDNCTVENAMVGAWTTRELTPGIIQAGYTGGRIYGTSATFKNCITGVRIDPYQRTGSGGNVLNNLCQFNFCSFITDAAWPDPTESNPLYHAQLQYVKGIQFNQCKFRNDSPGQFPLLNRGWGIFGIMAGFDVVGTTATDASLFQNLSTGVAAGGFINKVNIRQSWFRDNLIGSYLQATVATEVSRSHFYVPEATSPNAPMGLVLHQSTGYTVEENNFLGGTGFGGNIGIHWKGDVLQENRIYNNTFTGLNAGTYVLNRHKGNTPTTEDQGLQILCGDYTGCGFDYYLGNNTRIRGDQGVYNEDIPDDNQLAGNRFFSGAINGIMISSVQPSDPSPYFDYKRHNVPECDPINPSPYYSDYIVNTATAFDKAADCGNGYLPGTGGGSGGVIGFELAAAQLQSAQANLNGTVDTGEREDILEAIKQDAPWLPSHTLRDYLLARCPLSDEVLLAVIGREQPMDDWHITQVMLANARLTEQVRRALQESELLNAYMLAIVLNAGSGPTVKDLLRDEVVLRGSEKARYFAIALDEWATDSITPDPDDSLRAMLGAHPDPSDYYLLAELDMERGDHAAATEWLDALVVAKAEDPVLLRELVNMHQTLGGDWNQADGTQRDELAAMASSSEPGAAMAWAILYQLGETVEVPTAEMPIDERSVQVMRTNETATNDRAMLEAHPNPTTGKSWAVISIELDDAAVLRVSDPLGREVRRYRLVQGQQLVELDLADLAEGLYTCEILLGEYKLGVTKVTVQR
ncbi:MAG: hypothetical protein IPM12_12780 [Flavobacteriales bacterium]|nr:hypothetical protein [Flavobacteriales bacterium]